MDSNQFRYQLLEETVQRFYVGDKLTDGRWRDRWVEVLIRSNPPRIDGRRAPTTALVEFDTGERIVVPTYSGGSGATLRLHEQ